MVRLSFVLSRDGLNCMAQCFISRGFNEVLASNENGVYYQSWVGSTPTVNTGPTGLQNFGMRVSIRNTTGVLTIIRRLLDNVITAAKSNGLRLIVAL